jgi:predicted DCC family thiol-disulfide oxidoreductase YuxK
MARTTAVGRAWGALVAPVLVFDGACAFCRRWVGRWDARTQGRVRFAPLQRLPLWALGVRRAEARKAVHLVEWGRVSRGAEAVFRTLLRAPEPEVRWRARLGLLPGVRHAAGLVYAGVARHRLRAARLDRALFGRSLLPPTTRGVSWLVLRGLGGVFLLSFTSLGRQVRGLYGERGVLPVGELLAQGRAQLGARERWRSYPSLFWLTGGSDRALVGAARAGQGLSLLLLANVAPQPALLGLWALHLSFVSVGRAFLGFQWDSLLLEAALHALAVAPPGLRPGAGRSDLTGPQRLAQRLLLFRLYLGSGLGKWQSGDATWRDLTAMAYHHETTPLPTALGWHAHQLPLPVHKALTAATLALELGPPFLLFGPRRARQAAFAAFSAVQGGIALTGNYGFFNLLSGVLGLWALDDSTLREGRVLPRLLPAGVAGAGAPRSPARTLWGMAVAAPLLALSAHEALGRFGVEVPGVGRLRGALRPLRSSNSYALFSVMTTERPEIAVEGSADGRHWRPYRFRAKPDLLEGRPRWVQPHMPRLDWQMWFAALGSPSSWFLAFLERLLQGSPEVLGLLGANPFPDAPPRYVRAVSYRYSMTGREERRGTGRWWRRERLGLYVPPLALDERGRVRVAREVPRDVPPAPEEGGAEGQAGQEERRPGGGEGAPPREGP